MTGHLLDKRFIVLGGKGGVGRTTVAAALAHAAAARGRRVLIAQTDAPERLGRLFGRPGPIGPKVVPVAERTFAVNMTPKDALHEYALKVLRYEAIYRTIFENRAARGFLAAVPGLDAYAMLGKAFFHAREEEKKGRAKYDLVILDGPASGHTHAMLRIPQALLDAVPHGPLAPDARTARDLMCDGARTSLVLVTLAEDLPVRETAELARRAREDLGMPLGPVVVNAVPSDRLVDPEIAGVLDRLSPPTGHAGLDATLRVAESLRAHRATAEEMLGRLRADPGLPLVALPRLYTTEVGPAEVERLASLLGGGLDGLPAA